MASSRFLPRRNLHLLLALHLLRGLARLARLTGLHLLLVLEVRQTQLQGQPPCPPQLPGLLPLLPCPPQLPGLLPLAPRPSQLPSLLLSRPSKLPPGKAALPLLLARRLPPQLLAGLPPQLLALR